MAKQEKKSFVVLKKWKTYNILNHIDEVWLLEEPETIAWLSNMSTRNNILSSVERVETDQYFPAHVNSYFIELIKETPYWVNTEFYVDSTKESNNHKCSCSLEDLMRHGCKCGGN